MHADDLVTFTDQEGIKWDMAFAECPRCQHRPKLSDRTRWNGYFRCTECSCMFDEPHFRDAEIAFFGEA